MGSGDILVSIVGWLIVLYLANRNLRRAEISRLKDKLIEHITDVPSEFRSAQKDDNFDLLDLEELLTHRISLIELRINQLNHYIGVDLFRKSQLVEFLKLDLDELSVSEIQIQSTAIQCEMLFEIEQQYDYYFSKKILTRLWHRHKFDLAVIGSVYVVLALFFHIVNFFY